MRFSVLLPTRNRIAYLRYAIETVLRQDFEDWEVIISDNDSEDDIRGYVRSVGDPRIRYCRTERFVPVTDNWNNALERSSGEYIIMLGDDDCLLKGYFREVDRLIQEYSVPDCIYTGAYIYVYPDVMPDCPEGYLQLYCNPIFSSSQPFWLEREQAYALLRQSMNFRMAFTYNMQHSVISRRFIQSLSYKGKFFQSPYPDFYATNVVFLKGERILIYQRPLVVIGISPKSYGFFHFNKKEKAGMEFLQNAPESDAVQQLQRVVLPGSKNITSWLFAMQRIKDNYGCEFNLSVGYQRYRFLQTVHVYKNFYFDKTLPASELAILKSQTRWWEKVIYGPALTAIFSLMRMGHGPTLNKLINYLRGKIGQYTGLACQERQRGFKTIMDVFEQVEALRD